jgi:lactobin A/cerein 7B family class IIb bacteriocin
MKNLTNKELNNIEGGLLKTSSAWIIVGAVGSLIIGIMNGIFRPLACKSEK